MDNDEIKSENSHDIKLTLATKSDNVIYSSEADSNKVIKKHNLKVEKIDARNNHDVLSENNEINEQLNIDILNINIFKQQIFRNGKIMKNAGNSLKEIYRILINYMEPFYKNINFKLEINIILTHLLYVNKKNDFYEILLHTMHSPQLYKISAKLLFILLENKNYIPVIMHSKKFAFYLSEKIFQELFLLGTNKSYEEACTVLEFKEMNNLDTHYHEIEISEVSVIRILLKITRIIIQRENKFICLLNDVGFFNLINALVIQETAELYNAIFYNRKFITFHNQSHSTIENTNLIYTNELFKCYRDDAVYEIQRNQFPNEIIMQNKVIFKFKKHAEMTAASAIHNEIFDNLYNTILIDLIECFIENMYNVIGYKSLEYSTERISSFIKSKFHSINSKKPNKNQYKKHQYRIDIQTIETLLWYYKQYLDSGGYRDDNLITSIVENMNKTDYLKYLGITILYHHLASIHQQELTQSINIKFIFECLEYQYNISDTQKIFAVLKTIYDKNNISHHRASYLIVLRYNLDLLWKVDPMTETVEGIIGWIQYYFKNFICFITQNQESVRTILTGINEYKSKKNNIKH